MPLLHRKNKEYTARELFTDLAPYLAPYKWTLALATTLRVAADLAALYPPLALALVVNFLTDYEAGVSLSPVWTILGLFAAAVVARFIGIYGAKMLVYRTSERMKLDLENAALAHFFRLDISWHERENTGNKLKRITRGAESADRILRIWINNVLEIVINFIGITYVIARFDLFIAALTGVFLVTYYVLAYLLRGRAKRVAIAVNLEEEELQGVFFEALNNIRTVKVLGMAASLGAILRNASTTLLQKVYNRVFWFQTGSSVRHVYANLFQIGILVLVILGITAGKYEVGFLVLFFGYFSRLVGSVSELADITQEYVIAKLSVGRMFEAMREPVIIDTEEGKVSFPADWKTIQVQNTSFGYGSNEVLKSVSLTIRRGEKVGIVGLSGAGKSTLFKLLLKEHESYTGEILVDGVPLKTISKQDYFKYSAVVLQDTEVFNLSLRDNVTLANSSEENNEAQLERALRVAHVEDFLSRLPDGVETFVGEKGVRLSGGERQRLGIARAVFKSPQLLLLDEATSHLDIESEEKIRESLHEFFKSVTAVVIAHRLTTIREMDRIVVLEGGKILEEGSFAELYAKKGRFYELWEKQNL
ncbi:MAG TPA: ABC transporter ATP-binding protein [Candidatus Paceibacterota bacterium]|jgi:ABC-type multidrug transport system fused ATPase/permease subunit